MNGRTWTETGAELVEELGGRCAVCDLIDRLDWKAAADFETGAYQGHALNALIGEFGIPEVERLAEAAVGAGRALYGIEAVYSNGRARIFALDTGEAVTVLCHGLIEETTHA